MKNVPLLIGTIVATLILIIGVSFFFSQSTQQAQSQAQDPAVVAGDKRNRMGAENASITIVEFSDFQCPSCKAAAPIVKQVLAEFPDSVEFVYRQFPLDSIHPNARLAAKASEVAGDYGKFWEMHDILFEKQEEWSQLTSQDQVKETFGDYAAQLQIDKTEFLSKIDEESYGQKVQADVAVGDELAVRATPTFFVNGTVTTAPQLRSTVQTLVEAHNAD